jgi:hypothetical protein
LEPSSRFGGQQTIATRPAPDLARRAMARERGIASILFAFLLFIPILDAWSVPLAPAFASSIRTTVPARFLSASCGRATAARNHFGQYRRTSPLATASEVHVGGSMAGEDTYHQRFRGVDRLYGPGSGERLRGAHVAVIGLGGVGSWVVEALARSGIGHMTIVDMDEVCISNTNRQLCALDNAVGRFKADVVAERVAQINPECRVATLKQFITVENVVDTLTLLQDAEGLTFVVDAIDGVDDKAALLTACTVLSIPVVRPLLQPRPPLAVRAPEDVPAAHRRWPTTRAGHKWRRGRSCRPNSSAVCGHCQGDLRHAALSSPQEAAAAVRVPKGHPIHAPQADQALGHSGSLLRGASAPAARGRGLRRLGRRRGLPRVRRVVWHVRRRHRRLRPRARGRGCAGHRARSRCRAQGEATPARAGQRGALVPPQRCKRGGSRVRAHACVGACVGAWEHAYVRVSVHLTEASYKGARPARTRKADTAASAARSAPLAERK